MDITYDPRYNIAYVRLREKTIGLMTVEVSAELHVDISPDGKVYGFELMNAREQLIRGKRISFREESTGRIHEFSLPSSDG